MKKRVNCELCENFIQPVPIDPENMISEITKAGCKLGKRVMFRKPKSHTYWYFQEFGYIRWCEDFKPKTE